MDKVMRTPKAVKSRRVCWEWRNEEDHYGVLRITEGGKDSHYFVRPLGTDFDGEAWELSKLVDGEGVTETYHVHLGEPTGCDCKWGTYRGDSKACRHVAALLALRANGML